MGKLKKVGIGFGIVIALFIVLVIISQVWMAGLTPEERQQLEDERNAKESQAKIDAEQKEKTRELIELSKQKQAEREEAEALEEEKAEALQKQKDEARLDTEKEVTEFMQNYKGSDNAGPTLARTFELISAVSYPNENIFASPSTTVSMFAHRDFDKSDFNRYWKVELEIKTYRETAYYEWIIDTDTNLVYPGNEGGEEILDILDNSDK